MAAISPVGLVSSELSHRRTNFNNKNDCLFDIVVTMSDIQRGPEFDPWLYPRNFSESTGSGAGYTQPHEDN